jgi:hypothetical protein
MGLAIIQLGDAKSTSMASRGVMRILPGDIAVDDRRIDQGK